MLGYFIHSGLIALARCEWCSKEKLTLRWMIRIKTNAELVRGSVYICVLTRDKWTQIIVLMNGCTVAQLQGTLNE